jgi:2-phospho-L-lactate guanylyltransferase
MTSSDTAQPRLLPAFAIVPVKPLRQAKSRLARVLKPPLRATLVRHILARTLDLLNHNAYVDQTLVISHDVTVLDLARSKKAIGLAEADSTLNAAITQSAQWAAARGAGSILIVPVDLPLLTEADLESMIELAVEPRCIVIAPDRHGSGTNALLVRPPDAITFAFGPSSFNRHCALATQQNLPVHIYRSDTVALDLDVPDDLALYRQGSSLFDARPFSE